jgi:hypothetical protein
MDPLTAAPEVEPTPKSGRKCDSPIIEGILKIMADLGIDTNITREVS